MRICMIISTPIPPEEGIGFYTYNLSKNLIESGHEVSIITRGNEFSLKTTEYDGIKIYRPVFLPVYPFHVHLHQFFVEKLLKNLNGTFDFIHIHSPLSPPVKIDTPIVSTVHSSLIGDIKHYPLFTPKGLAIKLTTHISSKPLTQKLIKRSKVITTVSTAVAKELSQYYEIENLKVVGNGVNEKIYCPKEQKEKSNYILYVGKLQYPKGTLDLIKTANLLKRYNIKIKIAGNGPLKQLFKNEVVKNELINVQLLGHVSGPDLVKLYQNALIFIFPSHYEGLPTVVLEAMSCGLPVIITDIPAHRDLVENGKNGLFFKKGSPEDL